MSKYYEIEGMKVRVSNHEPNESLNGSSDIYIWTNDACGTKLSIGAQIDKVADKKDLDFRVFEAIINDFAEVDEECMYMQMLLN